MDKGIGMYTQWDFTYKKKRRIICRKMDGAGEHHAKTDRKANTFLSYTEYRLDDIKVRGALFGKRGQENVMGDK